MCPISDVIKSSTVCYLMEYIFTRLNYSLTIFLLTSSNRVFHEYLFWKKETCTRIVLVLLKWSLVSFMRAHFLVDTCTVLKLTLHITWTYGLWKSSICGTCVADIPSKLVLKSDSNISAVVLVGSRSYYYVCDKTCSRTWLIWCVVWPVCWVTYLLGDLFVGCPICWVICLLCELFVGLPICCVTYLLGDLFVVWHICWVTYMLGDLFVV